jgi:hypothetical protein
MAYIICEKHGGNVADFTSPLLASDMINGILHDPNDIHRLNANDIRKTSLLLDKAFLEQNGLSDLQEFDVYNLEEGSPFIFLYENCWPVCSFCFKEYLMKLGITR